MRSPMQAILAVLRWLQPRKPPDDDTPAKRFEKAHGFMFAAGIVPVGGIAALCVVNAFAVLIHAGSVEWPPLLAGLVILTPPGGFLIWVALALKKKRPWARKTAALLCVAGIIAFVGGFAWLWIGISDLLLFVFRQQETLAALRVSPSTEGPPWYTLYALFGFSAIAAGVACVVFGMKLFRGYEYLTSDEVKRICGEMPEVPGGGNP